MKVRDKLLLALADFLLILTGMFLTLALRLEFVLADMEKFVDWFFLLSIASMAVASFSWFGLYKKVWRYAGTHELVGVVVALTITFLPFQAMVIYSQGALFPRTTLPLAWMVCVFLCGGVRLALRISSEHMGRPMTYTRVIIVGAGDAGESVLRDLTRGRKPYTVVGFVDDDGTRAGMRIRGVRVMGKVSDLPSLVSAHLVTELILTESRPAQVRQIMDLCQGKEIQIKVIPALSEMVEGRAKVSRLRELSIEDLLERDPVKTDPERVAALIRGKRVLVTGAGGSIGSEICRQVSLYEPAALILIGRGENSLHEVGLELPESVRIVCDVTRKGTLRRIFEQHRPQVVFHAAAHKHVPFMEAAAAEAVHNNVFGTLNVMELAAEFATEKFIMLSTDKAVNPTSVMGASKRIAELLIAQQHHCGFAAVRFGNVLGSRGSVVPTFRRQIEQGGPITITDPDMTRFFMTIPEAVALVLQAASLARGGEIYILDMGKPVRILDLAKNLIRLSGFEESDIEIRVVGRRAGEKNDEELVNRGEETEATEMPKVTRVSSAPPPPEWPGSQLEELRRAADTGDHERSRELLMSLVANWQASAGGDSPSARTTVQATSN